MKIYLVRHGQTDANYEGRMQGRGNKLALNETGVRETKRLKEKLKGKQIDLCITSPLKRTWETAVILVGDQVYIEQDSRLIERDLGEYEDAFRQEYDVKKYWDYALNSNDCGVERIRDILKRSKDFLEDIKEKYPNQNILIVSHGAIIRSLHHLLIGTDFEKEKDLTKLEINNSFFREYDC